MSLTRVLVACNDNEAYLRYWPLVRRAWREIVGIEATMVLIADQVPSSLVGDEQVVPIAPVAGVHTALQAQVVRLLAPAVFGDEGAVIISDMDMVPMSRRWFIRPARRIEDRLIVYRRLEQIPMCYVAGRPSTWAEVFRVGAGSAGATWADVRVRLGELTVGVPYDGTHGGVGWDHDQQVLTRELHEFDAATQRVTWRHDASSGFRRLDRSRGADALRHPSWRSIAARRAGLFTDFHMLAIADETRGVNDDIVDDAIRWGRRRDLVLPSAPTRRVVTGSGVRR